MPQCRLMPVPVVPGGRGGVLVARERFDVAHERVVAVQHGHASAVGQSGAGKPPGAGFLGHRVSVRISIPGAESNARGRPGRSGLISCRGGGIFERCAGSGESGPGGRRVVDVITDGEAVVAVLVAQAARGDCLALGISLALVLRALLSGDESRVVCGPLGVLLPVALAGAARVLGAARMLGAELEGRRAALPNLSTYQGEFPYLRGPGMAEGISIGATQKWPVEAGGVGQRRWTAEVRRSRWIGRFLALKRSAGYGCRFGEPGTFVQFGERRPHAAPGRHDSHPRTVQRLAAWSRCTRFDA
ncbi:Uncharacterised protein [Mycobacteroides abscessus subsp. bolletii]|nr:Uncharacterised protein [Mycobacteroides abscessus subsp. bolletii]SHR33986.1 Uncharacterised protein [Mycobacteroides abscessus subsp. bolletii]SHR78910.1 Uncharacterised protein [Mycobacteroides abscessus subsp. bolletii]SHS38433.1 Uncharacterised protein [Mycobacteroides abscessus subsp. bolletii]SHX28599.1 Uncharacterised protein [Mycobacteroides abscessus subsp. bolletii]